MPRLCRFARQGGHDAFAVDNQATLAQLRDVAIAQHRSCVQDQRQSALVGEDRRQAPQFLTGITGSSWLCRVSCTRMPKASAS